MTGDLRARILADVRTRGPMTFREFMHRALYEPGRGYYARGPDIGPGGDFSTSARFPAFSRALARVALQGWRTLDEPADFRIVELGAGTGALAQGILGHLAQAAPGFRPQYVTVDESPELRAVQARIPFVHACARMYDLPPAPGLVIANEVLDALPVHRVVGARDGDILELFVGEKDGHLAEVALAPSTPALAQRLAEEGVRLAPGQKGEVCLEFDALFAGVGHALSRGYALFIDYGDEADALYAPIRREGTLATYHKHQRGADPFVQVGAQDITADVDFTAATASAKRAGLAPLLRADQGALLWTAGGLRDEAAAAHARADASLLQEIAQLCMPMGLGQAFEALLFAKGGAPAPFGGAARAL